MRDTFIGYYDWTPDEFDELWNKALFVFDTNTLLNIYRYKTRTCDQFLETLEKVKGNTWLPYQVGFEFHKNRRNCINEQREAYKKLTKALQGYANTFEQLLRQHKNHKLLDTNKLASDFQGRINRTVDEIDQLKGEHPDYSKSDSVLEKVTSIFGSKIGKRLDEDALKKIYTEGKKRYDVKIPPGYMDKKDKPEPGRYGDLVIWKEIMRKAKDAERPIILITSDNKEDWWLVEHGKTFGPRPELLQEFYQTTGQRCYIYQPSPFIERARDIFELDKADEEVLEEIKDVRESSEEIHLKDWFNLFLNNINKDQTVEETSKTNSQTSLGDVFKQIRQLNELERSQPDFTKNPRAQERQYARINTHELIRKKDMLGMKYDLLEEQLEAVEESMDNPAPLSRAGQKLRRRMKSIADQIEGIEMALDDEYGF
jgi:hypothetical protein